MIDRYKSLTTSLTNIENNEIYWKNPFVQSIQSVLFLQGQFSRSSYRFFRLFSDVK